MTQRGRETDEGKEEREKVRTPLLVRERVCACAHCMKGSRSKGERITLIGAVWKLKEKEPIRRGRRCQNSFKGAENSEPNIRLPGSRVQPDPLL